MTDIATTSFADFGVDEQLCSALAVAGITTPFPIQELTLGMALSGADLIGQARTGTGKTLAFGIPLLQRVSRDDIRTQALVIVPTRELCLQVRNDLDQAGAHKGVTVVAAYGGRAIEPQVEAIAKGAPIVVGTPGRLLDLLRRGTLTLSTVTALVLDEADEMLDLGFLPDVEQLIQATADQRQTMLFSATMPSAVVALARRYMSKPTFLRADVEEVRIAPETVQHFFSCHRMDKPAVLARILQTPGRDRCLVFSRTKRMADILAEELRQRGINAAPIHSDLRQDARERALARFRNGTTDVLVATEVAARGLDISDVSHVVNYDCPDDEKMYLHRIGRTGRAGAAGVAITLAVWNELARLEMIKKALGVETETHEVFSTSPVLDELFDLPARVRTNHAAAAAAQTTDEPAPAARKAAPRRGSRGRTPSRSTEDKTAQPAATAAT
ncbi:MAG: DEAD/DEAH box helicase, partial [Actinomycetota bacterium]|nr:DEAD/DEAH box helicase [Actinomycetota bacterium]